MSWKNGLAMVKLLRAEKTERLDKILCYLNTLHTLNYLYQFSWHTAFSTGSTMIIISSLGTT